MRDVSTAHVYTVILGGGRGSRLYPLTRDRAKPAVPLGAKYRLIDIPLSNAINSGFRNIAVLTQFKPRIVILALGANDGLRGLPVPAMKDNLAAMLKLAKQHGARVLLVGMHLPPNYGPQYTAEFDAAFRDLARREKVALLPFLLEPIALERDAYQADGLHPTAAAQAKILDHVWTALKPLLS